MIPDAISHTGITRSMARSRPPGTTVFPACPVVTSLPGLRSPNVIMKALSAVGPLVIDDAAAQATITTGSRDGAVGGDEGNRTPNPSLAKAVLCQLSYVPLGRPESDAGLNAAHDSGAVASRQRSASALAER
jgi:hypothetical protein